MKESSLAQLSDDSFFCLVKNVGCGGGVRSWDEGVRNITYCIHIVAAAPGTRV